MVTKVVYHHHCPQGAGNFRIAKNPGNSLPVLCQICSVRASRRRSLCPGPGAVPAGEASGNRSTADRDAGHGMGVAALPGRFYAPARVRRVAATVCTPGTEGARRNRVGVCWVSAFAGVARGVRSGPATTARAGCGSTRPDRSPYVADYRLRRRAVTASEPIAASKAETVEGSGTASVCVPESESLLQEMAQLTFTVSP